MVLLLALLQFEADAEAATVDQTLVIMLSVLAVVTVAVLGLRFLRNMFEVITAPTASLKYHGQNDHFFFSLMLVFLGGLIGTIILVTSAPKVVESFSAYSTAVAADIAANNSNPTYRDVAETRARVRVDSLFDLYFVKNMIIMPMVFMGLWLVVGTFAFLFARMFAGQVTTWVDMHGTIAYSAFFWAIGLSLAVPAVLGFIASMVGGAGPDFGVAAIIGVVLLVYALVLFLIGVNQAGDLTVGQTIGVILGMVVVFGGLGYWGYAESTEAFAAFKSQIQSFDPSKQQV